MNTASTQFQFTLNNIGTYYWKIENDANGTMGSASPIRMFTVTLNTSVGNTISGLKVEEVTPNPATTSLTIRFTNDLEFNGAVQILDLQGNIRMTLGESTISAAKHTMSISLQNLSSGMYFLRILHPEGVIMKKIFINK